MSDLDPEPAGEITIVTLRVGKKRRKPNFEVDWAIGIFEAAILGMRIAKLTNAEFIIQSTDLVHILPQLSIIGSRANYIFEKQREKSLVISELYKYLRSYGVKLSRPPKKIKNEGPFTLKSSEIAYIREEFNASKSIFFMECLPIIVYRWV